MDFSDFLILQIHPHFYPKYTNLHQSYTNLAIRSINTESEEHGLAEGAIRS